MCLSKDRRGNGGPDDQKPTQSSQTTGKAKQNKPAAKPDSNTKTPKQGRPREAAQTPKRKVTSPVKPEVNINKAVTDKKTDQSGGAVNGGKKQPPREKKKLQKPNGENKPSPSFFYILRCLFFAFINTIYRDCYYVGIQLLRSTRTSRRRVIRKADHLRQTAETRKQRRKRNIRTYFREIRRSFTAPFHDIREHFRKLRRELEIAQQEGQKKHVLKIYLHMAWYFCKKSWKVVRFLLNYLLPVGAAVLLFFTVQNAFSQNYGLRVVFGGEQLGYIANESVYNQATAEVQARINNETDLEPVDFTPQFQLVRVDKSQLMSVDDLSNLLIQSSGSDLIEADGFYLESTQSGSSQMQLIGAVEDGTDLLRYLDGLLESYRTPDMDDNAVIQFVKKIQLKRGLYPVSALRSTAEIRAELAQEERGEKRYNVIAGDTPLRIAQKNGITFAELKALNPDVDVSLFPGDSLLISQSVPKMSVQVTTLVRYEETIPYNIKQETDPSKQIGWTNVKQEGQEGVREITAQVVMLNGEEISRQQISIETIEPAVDKILEVGGNRPLQVIPQTSASGDVPSGTFGWPTVAGSIGTGFLGYAGHTGADIVWSGCYGSPILASADGVVVASGWGGPYGYRVIVDHGGGVRTLYAHSSKLLVTVGEQVSRGQSIALIGRTGNVTGPHLHFEIIVNGTPQNPAPYLYN